MNAIAYTRCAVREVPDPSQSISRQEAAIQDYCHEHQIELLRVFHDIGIGGLNFNREGWNALEAWLSEHPGEVESLIVTDYSRVGRDTTASLVKIAFLEKEHGVKLLPLTASELPAWLTV